MTSSLYSCSNWSNGPRSQTDIKRDTSLNNATRLGAKPQTGASKKTTTRVNQGVSKQV